MADLAVFLAAAAAKPFAWGRHDCSLLLADWLIELGYPDAAADLRGRYSTALGCARLLKRRGGLVAVVDACAAVAGLSRTDAPRGADVGVVLAETLEGRQMVGAICTGRRWSCLGHRGILSAPASPIAAWAV